MHRRPGHPPQPPAAARWVVRADCFLSRLKAATPWRLRERAAAADLFVDFVGEGAAELEFGEAEAVAQFVGGAGEAFEFFAAIRVEKIELVLRSGRREFGKSHTDEADFLRGVPGASELRLNGCEDDGIEIGRFGERFGARDGFEIGVAQRERDGAGVKAGIAQALRGFLAEIAERGIEPGAVVAYPCRKFDCAKWIWARHR